MTLIQDFRELFKEKLTDLQEEIKLFPDDESFQKKRPDAPNSPEVLCKHIIGNIQHFIGAVLGKTEYQRDRESEFVGQGLTRETMIESIEDTKDMLEEVLSMFWNQDMTQTYPELFKGKQETIHYMLCVILGHLEYHRGQINYDRRII